MNIISPDCQIITAPSITKKIEKIARVCYKSEDKIGEGTDIKMIQNLLDRHHMAMLEHGDMCTRVGYSLFLNLKRDIETLATSYGIHSYMRLTNFVKDNFNPNERVTDKMDTIHYTISGNIRAWIETLEAIAENMHYIYPEFMELVIEQLGGIDPFIQAEYERCQFDYCKSVTPNNEQPIILIHNEDMAEMLYPEERMIHETFSVLFTVDRGVTHELVRMREASFAQESTRFCNYSIDKHNNMVNVIKPVGFDDWSETVQELWNRIQSLTEACYLEMTGKNKMAAQMARGVLTNNLKSDIVVTSTLRHWKHIFALRACDATGPAHPQMKEVMQPLLKVMRDVYPFAFGDMKIPGEI